jgi:hypothetical protein
MPRADARARAIVGRALVASAVITATFAGAVWLGWIPVASESRPWVAGPLVLVTALDLFLGLRFMAE